MDMFPSWSDLGSWPGSRSISVAHLCLPFASVGCGDLICLVDAGTVSMYVSHGSQSPAISLTRSTWVSTAHVCWHGLC